MNHKDIPRVRKIAIVREQVERWRNTHYAAKINHEVGKTIESQQMMNSAVTDMRNALKAIDLLEGMLAELRDAQKGEDDEG